MTLHFFKSCHRKDVEKRLQDFQDRLYRSAYAMCHDANTAYDLTQETNLRVLEKHQQLRDPEDFPAWSYRILVNCCRDHFRQQRDTVTVDDDHHIDELTPERILREGQVVAMVRQAMEGLTLDQRCVLAFVDLEGLSYKQVSQILEVPIGTVMSRLARARRALQGRITVLQNRAVAEPRYLRRVK